RAVDLYLATAPSRDGSQQIARILDALPTAALLIDRRCRVVRTNLLAEALLAKADGLTIAAGDGLSLKVETRYEANQLSRVLGRAVAVSAGETLNFRQSLRVTRPSGCPAFIVVVTPLPPAVFMIWDATDSGARALVQIIDPLASVEARAEFLKDAAGLTATEARVAGLVGGGRSSPEVAQMLGLSPATVRTHLARCFDKTGVRSQVQLAKLLASVADPSPAPDKDPNGFS
ncbi:MAG: helix-turn-helix transcriptional regulator, partial [Hansschlegelia sp.]